RVERRRPDLGRAFRPMDCAFAGHRQPGKFSGILALARASAGEMTLRRTRSARFWSSVCMPTLWPVWIAEYIWAILFSRIRFLIADDAIMISCAATRPEPSFSLH